MNEVVERFMTNLDNEAFVEAFASNPSQALGSIHSGISLDELFCQISTNETVFASIVEKVSASMEESALRTKTSSCE